MSETDTIETEAIEDKTEDLERVPLSNIRANDWNPNEQNDEVFNMLCEEISDSGFDQPIIVTTAEDEDDEEYVVVDGEHRLMAGRVVGMEEIPVIVHEDWDELDAKTKTVKRNMLKGELNREKFTELVDDVHNEFTGEEDTLARLMGMKDVNELEENYVGELRNEEPGGEDMDDFVDDVMNDEVEEEMDTVDNLSSLLNHIMDEYGDTSSDGYIWFMFKSTRQLMVNLDKELLSLVEDAVDELKEEDEDMRDLLKEFFEEQLEE